MKYISLILSLLLFMSSVGSHSLKESIESDTRDLENKKRDIYRHPYETLNFIDICAVLNSSKYHPTAFGDFNEPGTLITAQGDYYMDRFKKKIESSSIYEKVKIVPLNSNLAEENTVDAVLTFRNLHNWLGPQMDLIFSNTYKALKPGGKFGVVEHRAKPGTDLEMMKKSGYVTEDHAIETAIKHGFKLVDKSEINSNPKDTKDYSKGVWTLPPRLRLETVDRDKYISIGESDRMTLLFMKP